MRAIILALGLGFCLILPSWAQDPPKPKSLTDFKAEIGLSDEQVAAVTATLDQFKTQLKAYQDKLVANEKDLQLLLQQKADIEKLKTTLRTSSDLAFQMQYLDVVTSRKVEAIMTPEQLKKWHDIQLRLQQQQQVKK